MFGCSDPSRVSTNGRRVTGPCSSKAWIDTLDDEEYDNVIAALE